MRQDIGEPASVPSGWSELEIPLTVTVGDRLGVWLPGSVGIARTTTGYGYGVSADWPGYPGGYFTVSYNSGALGLAGYA